MASLLLLTGIEHGLNLSLQGDRTILGREQGKDRIVIRESMVRDAGAFDQISISRTHATITCVDETYYIEDGDGKVRKSRNGTFVNDNPIPFPGRVALKNNDRIRICNFVCAFQEEESSFKVEEFVGQDSSLHSLSAQPADKLRILLEISNILSKALEVDILLPQIVDQLLRLYQKADRGFIILHDDAKGQLVPRVAKTRRAGDEPRAKYSEVIVHQCLATGQAILGNDLIKQFPDSESISELPMRSLLCAPLLAQDGAPLGAIQLDLDGPGRKFTREDLNLLVGVASQASIALSNARLHRDLLSHQRRARDLELAHEVQRALLPQQLPVVPEYEFFAFNASAMEVGGDYYDFISLPGHRLGILLGDVAGKGVAAALITVKFSVEARSCLLNEKDPARAVGKLNELMCRAALTDRFVTLIAAVLDPATHSVVLVNAGHPSPLLSRFATGVVEKAAPPVVAGMPIGVDENHVYNSRKIDLQAGDRLLFFSDGVTDAMDAHDRAFGAKGAQRILEGPYCTPRKTGDLLVQAVKRHTAQCSQYDDITLVSFGRAAP
jgi:serine phosphatase RsbU (regulator of sigma subunit)/pSer/pThr/pTyr-binding forkhead associated (FHA) protein